MNRARLITTREGKFINVHDIKLALRDDQFVNEKLVPLLKVGHDKGDSITDMVRAIGGAVVYELLIAEPSKERPVSTALDKLDTETEDVPDFDKCIKQIAAHLDHQGKTYIEIALDPNTNEIGWSFTATEQ